MILHIYYRYHGFHLNIIPLTEVRELTKSPSNRRINLENIFGLLHCTISMSEKTLKKVNQCVSCFLKIFIQNAHW